MASVDSATKGQVEQTEMADLDHINKEPDAAAQVATDIEHQLSIREALHRYNRAVIWSILISLTVIMEGYDNTLLNSFMAYPAFRKKYGEWHNEESGYQISAEWQITFGNVGAVANIVGALLNGYVTPKYGHRRVIMGTLTALSAFIFIVFFAPNTKILLLGNTLFSVPMGIFATTGPSYAAEVTPVALRGYLTAYINLCWCTGQFISAGVLKGLVNNNTQWGYRIPFGIQWIWPLPIFAIAYFAPESPWFLVRSGRNESARRSLQRLANPACEVDHDAAIALIIKTNQLEREEQAGVTYKEAFMGTNLRRTEIGCMAFLSQVTNGGYLCYSAAFFFEQAGIGAGTAYGLALGGTGIAFICTLLSSINLANFGRRTIYLWGFSGLVIVLYLIGILACPPQTEALSYTQAGLCLVWLGWYSLTLGPVTYCIVSEIGSTRMRTQTITLGRSLYYVGNMIGGALQPQFMSPTAWNAKGKTAFFWGTTALLTTTWAYFRLPETKDRTFEEMDTMFLRKLPARRFAKYDIEQETGTGAVQA